MKHVTKLAVAAVAALSVISGAVRAETLLVACDTTFVPFEFKQGN
jgi:glutamine transport system substrate-binding protein